jgi:hypothetical protein
VKKTYSRKLVLAHTTIRNLTELQIEAVAGGSLVSFKPVTCSKIGPEAAERISTC